MDGWMDRLARGGNAEHEAAILLNALSLANRAQQRAIAVHTCGIGEDEQNNVGEKISQNIKMADSSSNSCLSMTDWLDGWMAGWLVE